MRVGIAALAWSILAVGAEGREPVDPDPLAPLVSLYRSYELPIPPQNSQLYRYVADRKVTIVNGVRQAPDEWIGFGVSFDSEGQPKTLLFGIVEFETRSGHTTSIKLDEGDLAKDPAVHADLCFAIQCEILGRRELAKSIVETRSQNKSSAPPEHELAKSAWTFWSQRFREQGADRALVARRLSGALGAAPSRFTPQDRLFLEHLVLSLQPTGAAPGSVDALIDEFIEISGRREEAFGSVPPKRAVVRRGFEAIPALIEHLDDNRLTRAVLERFDNFPGYQYRVRHFARDILQGFADPQACSWLYQLRDDDVDVASIRTWWTEISQMGEEAYALQHVLTSSNDAVRPNPYLLELLEYKYPRRLPEVYRRLLRDRPEMTLDEVADALGRSSIDNRTKRDLLILAIDSDNPEWRLTGLQCLQSVEADEFHQRLVRLLATLSTTPAESYWNCVESRYSYLVSLADDPKAWDAAEQYLRRADAGIRLEWLQQFGYRGDPSSAARRIEFVARFLADETVRDAISDPDRFDGPYAGFTRFKQIEVRNYAALVLGGLLELKEEPARDWSADRWAAFREQVRTALAARK